MLQQCFNNSPYEAINNSYPNTYKEWEFKNITKGIGIINKMELKLPNGLLKKN